MSALRRRPRAMAIVRSPLYSPMQHRANDLAILDATIRELRARGWRIRRITERAATYGPLPEADIYLNMCQGPAASQALIEYEQAGVRFFNPPSSVLGCHRQRLIPALERSSVPFPATVLLDTTAPLSAADEARVRALGDGPLWLKRSGVHAERPEDVVAMDGPSGLAEHLAAFAARSIRGAALQAHVAGPVVKFYGVAGGALFHAYDAETKMPLTASHPEYRRLRALGFEAAGLLSLDIFGGDVVLHPEDGPVLIDLNDWPSFAPIRDRAARAIAGYVHATHRSFALR